MMWMTECSVSYRAESVQLVKIQTHFSPADVCRHTGGRNLHHPAEERSPGPLHSTCCPLRRTTYKKTLLVPREKRIESEVPRHFKIKLSLLSPFLSHGTPQDSGLNWQKSTLMK